MPTARISRSSYNHIEPNRKSTNKVLIGIIDVGGFDFSHPEFLDGKGQTRFRMIWDQSGNFRKPTKSTPYGYGTLFTNDHMNEALRQSKKLNVPAYMIESSRRLQSDLMGHTSQALPLGIMEYARMPI